MLIESVLSCLAALRAFFQTRSDTALEILALRQQLAVLKRKVPRPNWTGLTESFGLPSTVTGPVGPTFLLIVKPETVVGWHRAGFRLYWRLRSRSVEAGLRSTKRFAS